MPSQVRRNFIVYKNEHCKILEELMAEESRSLVPTQQYYVFDYVESLSEDLSKLSAKADNPLLSYLLAMAMQEARDSKSLAERHGSTCTG
jgi:hypothetical protein